MVEIPDVRVRSNAETTVRVSWDVPAGTAVNSDAPFRVRWDRSDGLAEAPADMKATGGAVKDGFQVRVRPMAGAPNASLHGAVDIVVCDDVSHSACLPVRRPVELDFTVVDDAAAEVAVTIALPSATPTKALD